MSTPIDIKETVEQQLLSIPGVYGVGLGHNSPQAIHVYIKSECPNITCNIPDEIGGVPVKKIVTGKITSLTQMPPASIDRTARERPYYGGVSIGSLNVTAGTLGVKCYDVATRDVLILTNNHVGANETSIQAKTASVGDPLLQPGVYDGGINPDDKVGTLERYIELDQTGDNEVDGAVARPDNRDDFADSILEIGNVSQIGEAIIGDVVEKSGRSSGLNESTVVDVNATLKIDYETVTGVTFKNQIVIVPAIGFGGDSGSVIVRKRDNKAVGLLCAGSDTITVANRMTIVADALSIDLGEPAPKPSQEPAGMSWGTVAALGLPLIFIMKKKDTGRR